MNEIVEILRESNPLTNGYRIESDKDQNSYFILEQSNRKNVIWLYYSNEKKKLVGLGSSIVYSDIQRVYAELCYPIITKSLNQYLDKTSFQEQMNNPTINCGTTMETPNGIIESRFENYSLTEYNQLRATNNIDANQHILEFVDWYYKRIESSFFSRLKSIEDLDSITDNLNIYELGLYLTNVPKLKKIIIKYLLNKPEAIELQKEYENLLIPNKGDKMADLILECLRNIRLKYENE